MPQIIDLGKIRFDFQGVYGASVQYEKNDVVKYGGSTYVYINQTAANSYLPTNTTYWAKMTEGIQFENSYSASTQYQLKDVVRYGSSTYVANQDTISNDPENETYWDVFTEGIGYRDDWVSGTEYYSKDIVNRGGLLYLCQEGHTSGGNFNTDLGLEFWIVFTEGFRYRGAWVVSTGYLVNDIVTDGTDVYIAISDHTSGASVFGSEPGGRWDLFVPGADYLPSQQGNTNSLLITDGTNPLWAQSVNLSGSAQFDGALYLGASAAEIAQSVGLSNLIGFAVGDAGGSSENFTQFTIWNKNTDGLASTDLIVQTHDATDLDGFIDMGITGENFDAEVYGITGPNDGYIFMVAPAGTSGDGNLVLATGDTGAANKIIFAAGGLTSGTTQMEITPNVNVHIEIETPSTSPSTGALTIVGGVGTTGDMNILGNLSVQGSQSIIGDINILGSITVAGGQFVTENLSSIDPLFFVGNGNEGNVFDLGLMTEAKQPSASVSVPIGSVSVSASVGTYTGRSYSVVFKQIVDNVGTVTLSANHQFILGNKITLSGVDATFNGSYIITGKTNNKVSFSLVSSAVSETAATGTAQINFDGGSRTIIAGDFITVSGAGSAEFNGVHHVVSATTTTLNFAINRSNLAQTSLPENTLATRNTRSKYSGLVKDHGNSEWYLFSNLEERPTSVVDFTDPEIEFDTLNMGSLFVSGTSTFHGAISCLSTINVFGSEGQRDSSITAPVTGTSAYLTDKKIQQYYIGAKWETVDQTVSPLLSMALL